RQDDDVGNGWDDDVGNRRDAAAGEPPEGMNSFPGAGSSSALSTQGEVPHTTAVNVTDQGCTEFFFSLTPEQILDAVERAGERTTGVAYALNSLENRVYEVELEGGARVVGKFYRPGRWADETIRDEHRLLLALEREEIPVCTPLVFGDDGDTLHKTAEGIRFALFPRMGGRSPDELLGDEYRQLGRLLGRIHNVAASLDLRHRPVLSPQTYGRDCLADIVTYGKMPSALEARYVATVERLVSLGEARFERALEGTSPFVVHADCHRANLLRRDSFFFLDFDDAAQAPVVQDLWLLLPARPTDCPTELEALVEGYEEFRAFDSRQLGLIEVLRGLRYIRYASWIARRYDDPAFSRAFPQFGTEAYWQQQLIDVAEQVELLEKMEQPYSWGR
ncbi:MAG: serine/threonine protein kinase, partial [Deltaproteobacteria bacterium]|nr:serine/threonine protein kinase [Deltaproteobacteria bacterium]